MNRVEPDRRQKVLVVDDDARHREIIVAALEGTGLHVLEAEDGDSAVAINRRERPGLVFLDLQLAGGRSGGLQVLQRLKEESADLRVVAYTAWALPQFRQQAIEAGCDGFLGKPVDLARVREVTAHYLGGGQSGVDPPEPRRSDEQAGGGGCRGSSTT